jgi:hypothetical protein
VGEETNEKNSRNSKFLGERLKKALTFKNFGIPKILF